MDSYDKGKLKVLIKMILISKSPKSLSANQIADFINKYEWGFRTPITSAIIGKLLSYELKKTDRHFLSNIKVEKKRGVNRYSLSSVER